MPTVWTFLDLRHASSSLQLQFLRHLLILFHQPPGTPQALYSPSCKTSYRKISWSLEAARFVFKLFQSLWNLAGTSAAALPRCLSNFRAILPLEHQISRLRDFTRFDGKTSYRLVNRRPESNCCSLSWPPFWTCQLFKSSLYIQYEGCPDVLLVSSPELQFEGIYQVFEQQSANAIK